MFRIARFSLFALIFSLITAPLFALDPPSEPENACKWGFLENQGQWEDHVLYRTSGSGFAISFMENGISFISGEEIEEEGEHEEGEEHEEHEQHDEMEDGVQKIDLEEAEYIVWNMHFGEANPHPKVTQGEWLAARTNYFRGNDPDKWLRNVPEYRDITYHEVWDGIDIRFRLGSNGELKYDFLLAAGADPEQIRLDYAGIESLDILSDGSLQIGHPWGPVTEEAPVAWLKDSKDPVALQFEKAGQLSYKFDVEGHVPEDQAWVIDPFMQVWSSYANPTSVTTLNYTYDVSYDQLGNLYICGIADASFLTTPGSYQTIHAGGLLDAYVCKFAGDGNNLIYMTYIGGNGQDRANTLTATANGELYVGGRAYSTNFPVTTGAFAATNPNTSKPFIAKLNPAGNNLLFSTLACDSCSGEVRGLVPVSNGEVIATGTDFSTGTFTATPGAFMSSQPGAQGMWVARYNANATSMLWGTHFGTSGWDHPQDIDVNDLEEPYIVGAALGGNLPTTPGAIQQVSSGGSFIARFNANGTGLVYCSYYGSGGFLRGVAVHPLTREAYVAGYNFQNNSISTPGAFITTGPGGNNGVVGRISADGTNLIYGTYLGGSGTDLAYGIGINEAGEAFVSGQTNSSDFPITPCQMQSGLAGSGDYFVAHLSATGDSLMCGGAALFGGTAVEYNMPRIAVRKDGFRDTLFCTVTSHSLNFPNTPNTFQQTNPNGTGDCPTAFKLVAVCAGPNVIPDTNLCALDSILINAPGQSTNLLWSTNATSPSIWISQSGQYWVSGLLNGCPFSDTFNIAVGGLAFSLGADTTICDASPFSIPLNPGAGTSWLWSNASTAPSINVTQPGTYWVHVIDSLSGCEGRDTIVVSQGTRPVLNLPTPVSICAGTPITLDADPTNLYPGASYLWSNAAVTQQATFSNAGWAWVELTNADGCTTRDSSLIVVNPLPTVNIGPDSTVCDTNVFTCDAGPGFSSYLWSNNAATQTTNFTQSGLIWVEVSDANGCTNRDSLLLTMAQQSPPNLGPNQSICSGNSVIFNADPGGQYPGAAFLWHNNATTPQTSVNTTGWVWVEVTTAAGCILGDSVFLTVNALPTVNIGPDTTLCDANVFTADAGPGFSAYLWSNNAATQTTNFTQSGLVWVQVTDANGCTHRDSLQLTLAQQAPPNLGPDQSICIGSTLSLNADPSNQYPGASFLWHNNATTAQTTVSSSGWAWVEVTTAAGCLLSDSLMLTLNPLPVVDIGPDVSICDQSSLTLDAGPGFTGYLWSDNTTGQTGAFGQSGTIWVQVTDANGCINRDSMLLNLGALPQPDLGVDTTLCDGNSLTLIPLGNGIGYSFDWNNNSTAAGITVNQSGMYSVIATELSSGCVGEDSILITVVPGPVPVLPVDTLVCDAGVFDLNPGSFDGYSWSEGSSTAVLSVNENGNYGVTVTDGNGCEGTTQALVRFNSTPSPDLGPDLELCVEERYSLSIPRVPGNLMQWSNGSAGSSMIVDESGSYWVEVSNECGRSVDTIQVVFLRENSGPFVPNAFVPGGEIQENSVFRAMGEQVEDFQLTVYDRWGALIYQTRTIQDGWDGTIDGKDAQEGVYVYVMQLRACDGQLVSRRGTVTLLR